MAAPFNTLKKSILIWYVKDQIKIFFQVGHLLAWEHRQISSFYCTPLFFVFFLNPSIGQTPTCDVCVSRDIRQLSTEKLLQNHMDLYTDSHHSDITQVMYNKVYTDDQSWDYTCRYILFAGDGSWGSQKKIHLFIQTSICI